MGIHIPDKEKEGGEGTTYPVIGQLTRASMEVIG
jgi:hypothetical protein